MRAVLKKNYVSNFIDKKYIDLKNAKINFEEKITDLSFLKYNNLIILSCEIFFCRRGRINPPPKWSVPNYC